MTPPNEFPDDLTSAEAAAWFPMHVKHVARGAFERQGEVHAMAILLCRRNPQTGLSFAKPQPVPVLLTGHSDNAGKMRVTDAVRKMAWKARAFGAAMMSEAWTLRTVTPGSYDEYMRNGIGKLGEHPDRREIVIVSWQHRAGGTSGSMAEIIREPGCKPILGPWEDMRRDGELSGQFVEFLPREDT